jgi:hypothetical protein
MPAWKHIILAVGIFSGGAAGGAAPEVSSLTNRPVLGAERTWSLRFDSSVVVTSAPVRGLRRPVAKVAATNVQMAGTWDSWTGRYDLVRTGDELWELDTRALNAKLGQHQFKFIVDGEWESGANRLLPINLHGEIEQPPAMIQRAVVDDCQDDPRVFSARACRQGNPADGDVGSASAGDLDRSGDGGGRCAADGVSVLGGGW